MPPASATPAPQLDAATYDVVRGRLETQGRELGERVGQLDQRRRALFGGTATTLLATERVRTEHNCVVRDIAGVGSRLLLGYQVFLGLKSSTEVADVFCEVAYDGSTLRNVDRSQLTGTAFEKDFREIFAYYKDARLLQLLRNDTHLLAAFQTGQKASDVRVLRWALKGHGADETLAYVDNRGAQDFVFPAGHDFTWTRTTRDQHVHGKHPHVNILDTVFIECLGGDLTIKVEDNTEIGDGVFSEPVKDPTQGLDDAEIHYADLETTVLLKVRPYREHDFRYLVFNKLTRQAVRIDAIGQSCRQLPEGHGLVFPGGYYLQDGAWKIFPIDTAGLEFNAAWRSPNGEDLAFVYYERSDGIYVILRYNQVSRSVEPPMVCNGHHLFADGRLVVFRAEPEPTRVHTMQIWQTPFCRVEHAAAAPAGDGSFLARLGNRELVRAVSELNQVQRLIANPAPTPEAYAELARQLARIADGHHWLGHDEAFGLATQLAALRATVDLAADEFEKARGLAAQAGEQAARLDAQATALLRASERSAKDRLDHFLEPLRELRALRGQIEGARGVRFADRARLDAIDARLVAGANALSAAAVAFLGDDAALDAPRAEIAELASQAAAAATVMACKPLRARCDAIAAGLDALIETVGGLDVEDATARTAIVERISGVYAGLNRARAALDGRRKDLAGKENRAGFAAAVALLTQAAGNALGLADSAAKCDEALGRLLVQVEELESRYAEVDEALAELTAKREEIAEAFGAKKQQLDDARSRRADGVGNAAERVIAGVAKRALALKSADELNAFVTTDPMAQKARALIAELRTLGAAVRADDLEGRLKAAREDAARHLRDRSELFDGELIRLGRHAFTVNAGAIDLVALPRSDAQGETRLYLHLTGTDYFAAIDDAGLNAARALWPQELPSEDAGVYRGEYLAWLILDAAERPDAVPCERPNARTPVPPFDGAALRAAARDPAALADLVHGFAAERYDEGYERGVHDADAAAILVAVLHLADTAEVLRHGPAARALALLWWDALADGAQRERWQRQCRSLHDLGRQLGASVARAAVAGELAAAVAAHARTLAVAVDDALAAEAGRYLAAELAAPGEPAFARSAEADELDRALAEHLRLGGADERLRADLANLRADPAAALRLATAWVERCAARHAPHLAAAVPEAAAGLLTGERVMRRSLSARTRLTVEGLLGQHPSIKEGRLELRIDAFTGRLARFAAVTVPAWRAYHQRRREVVAAERARLRLDEFKPRVLTSFVRNRLVNEVYLPLIGDNLAKQLGAAGAGRRTDLMGLLLLISPPGYGKTTLVEYVASVLGLAFIKVNGPAIGHRVLSLDPAEAPNATARQELEKLGLALEMANNVMLVIDDIQHCNPEFLQKFISLCDGQRRIEGVWRGATRTYDLRGKRFCVVMAGNPYTESGEQFKIPDMLANRADTYNLGDILGGHREAFELSYLENCLTVNPVLAPVATRGPAELARLLRLAAGDDSARSELEHPYSAVELEGVVAVLRHLRQVQRALLAVNQAYIASAGTADAFRSEPPFKLQGSYRNMAKLAVRVVPALTAAEVDALVLSHYQGEAQTLTTGAEANLLKLRQLLGALDEAGRARWAQMCTIYARRQDLAGADDPASKAVVMLAKLAEQLAAIDRSLSGVRDAGADRLADALAGRLAPLIERLGAAVASGDAPERLAGALSGQLAPLVERLGAAIAALPAARSDAGAQPAKIEIINTLPRYYAKLYQHHVQVIEQSLVPVLDLLGQYLGANQRFRANLEAITADLRQWAGRHAESQVLDVKAEEPDDGIERPRGELR